jgi:hypothetical protein
MTYYLIRARNEDGTQYWNKRHQSWEYRTKEATRYRSHVAANKISATLTINSEVGNIPSKVIGPFESKKKK